MTSTRSILACLAVALGVLFAVPAAATQVPLAEKPAAAPPAAAPPAGQPPAPYESPQRDACQAELDKDARWRAELGAEFEAAFHQAEARRVTTNNRHVVMAYGALWVLTVGFLALMFLRQRRLLGEIARLEADLERAKAS